MSETRTGSALRCETGARFGRYFRHLTWPVARPPRPQSQFNGLPPTLFQRRQGGKPAFRPRSALRARFRDRWRECALRTITIRFGEIRHNTRVLFGRHQTLAAPLEHRISIQSYRKARSGVKVSPVRPSRHRVSASGGLRTFTSVCGVGGDPSPHLRLSEVDRSSRAKKGGHRRARRALPKAPTWKHGGSRLYESLSTLLGIRACPGTGQVAWILKSAVRSPAVFSSMLLASAGPAFYGLQKPHPSFS